MEQVRRAHVLLEDPHLKGVLVIANSPGGLPAVSEAWGKFFERLQRKNVVVVAIAEDVCASGGYLAIMGMKRIFAYNSSIIGSVGAVMAYPNIYHILKKINVDYTVIKSGILKAEPQPYSAPRPEYAEEMQKMVNAIGVWFVDKVSSSRGLHNKDSIRQIIAKGGVFTAQEAQKLFLIDAIGDEIDALEYLRDTLQSPNIPCSVFAVDDHAWIQQMLRKYGVTAQFKAYLQPYLL